MKFDPAKALISLYLYAGILFLILIPLALKVKMITVVHDEKSVFPANFNGIREMQIELDNAKKDTAK